MKGNKETGLNVPKTDLSELPGSTAAPMSATDNAAMVTPEVTGLNSPLQEAPLSLYSGAAGCPSASGTLEVPSHEGPPVQESGDSDEAGSIPIDGEDLLLNSPATPGFRTSLEAATEQLGVLKVKKPNLTTKQRREAIKARLQARGEVFDPSKWKRGQRRAKRKKRAVQGGAPVPPKGPEVGEGSAKRPRGESATPPSAEGPRKRARGAAPEEKTHLTVPTGTSTKGVSYRDASAIKMAVVPQGFPEVRLTPDQGDAIEVEIMERFLSLEDSSHISFAGTFLDKGALIVCCLGEATIQWLKAQMADLKPLGEVNLIVGLRKDILKTTRIIFRAHPKLLRKTAEEVIGMLDKQNSTLNVKGWSILSTAADPKLGYRYICALDEACFKAVQDKNMRANLGLWQVHFSVLTGKEHVQGSASQPPPQ